MRKSRLMLELVMRKLGRATLLAWGVMLIFFGGGMTWLLSTGHSAAPIDGTLITIAGFPLGLYLIGLVTQAFRLGVQMSVGQRRMRWILTMTPLILAGLNQVMLSAWAILSRLRGAQSSSLLREFGYRGPWTMGAGTANVLFEFSFVALIGTIILLFHCGILAFGQRLLFVLLVTFVGLRFLGDPIVAWLQHLTAADSTAAVVTRRIANGHFSGLAATSTAQPWLIAGIALFLLCGMLALLMRALRTLRLDQTSGMM